MATSLTTLATLSPALEDGTVSVPSSCFPAGAPGTIRAAASFYGSSLLKKMLLGPLPSVEPKSDPRSLPSGVRPM
jgi:hypothetical protein